MARVKRGTIAQKRRRHVVRYAKGFRWKRKTKYRLAKEAMYKAWTFQFRDRKVRKRAFRQLWNANLGAALKEKGISYSRFINLLKLHKVELDRKMLSLLAREKPAVFAKVVEKITQKTA